MPPRRAPPRAPRPLMYEAGGFALLPTSMRLTPAAASKLRVRILVIVAVAVLLVATDVFGWNTRRPRQHRGRGRARVSRGDAQPLSPAFQYEQPGAVLERTPAVYRGAPWRHAVGAWLKRCEAKASSVPIQESFFGKSCLERCSGHGECDFHLGQCRCQLGYNGSDCTGLVDNACNTPASSERPFGEPVHSLCPSTCDHRTARCFCGPESPYPDRPVVLPCGFPLDKDGAPDFGNLNKDLLFGKDPAKMGWCMADPAKVETGEQKLPFTCYNNYDGFDGVFSEIKVPSFCINQCTSPANGRCDLGTCKCEEGWYGVDCSIPTAAKVKEGAFTPWLQGQELELRPQGDQIAAATRRKRPLIYVYDVPRKFSSDLIQGRNWKTACATRQWLKEGMAHNGQWVYGAEVDMYESMLASPHRTNNPEEADYFFVPFLSSCLMFQADDSPHLTMTSESAETRLRPNWIADWVLELLEHIRTQYGYWKRNHGRDHIWMFTWDEGGCHAPSEIANSIILSTWGNTEEVHQGCISSQLGDKCDKLPHPKFGDNPCFDPVKDIVVPPRRAVDFLDDVMRNKPYEERPYLFHYKGDLGDDREDKEYSVGIRQALAKHFRSQPDKQGNKGSAVEESILVEHTEPEELQKDVSFAQCYAEQMSLTKFCGVLPGDGFSLDLVNAVLRGCVPVIIQDGVEMPFENVLDYPSFSVRIREADIPHLLQILKGIPEQRVRQMLNTTQAVGSRFFYRLPIDLEARRQEAVVDKSPDWIAAAQSLKGDDAFTTIIQILDYKLYHDKWRKTNKAVRQVLGLPRKCQGA